MRTKLAVWLAIIVGCAAFWYLLWTTTIHPLLFGAEILKQHIGG